MLSLPANTLNKPDIFGSLILDWSLYKQSSVKKEELHIQDKIIQ